jgi:pyridoxamine 5'-phosphate oxidase
MDPIASKRQEYTRGGLSEADLGDENPLVHARNWLDEAIALDLPEPTAVTLATVGDDGRPSARVVLLKGLDDSGLTLYTNYESRKGRQMESRPWAAVVMFWPELERQVRFEGRVERVSESESDAYFASRPRGSRLGAWASPQSREIATREALEARLEEVIDRFGGADGDEPVPRPPHWGGYRLVPIRVELWQGRTSRLHDRFLYTRDAPGETWTRTRLAP